MLTSLHPLLFSSAFLFIVNALLPPTLIVFPSFPDTHSSERLVIDRRDFAPDLVRLWSFLSPAVHTFTIFGHQTLVKPLFQHSPSLINIRLHQCRRTLRLRVFSDFFFFYYSFPPPCFFPSLTRQDSTRTTNRDRQNTTACVSKPGSTDMCRCLRSPVYLDMQDNIFIVRKSQIFLG